MDKVLRLVQTVVILALRGSPTCLPCFHDSNPSRFTEWRDLIHLLRRNLCDQGATVQLLELVGEGRSPFYQPFFLEKDRETQIVSGDRTAVLVVRKVLSCLTYHCVNRTGIDVSHSNTLLHLLLAIILVYSFGNRHSAILPVFLDDIPCMANTSNSRLYRWEEITRLPNYSRILPHERKFYCFWRSSRRVKIFWTMFWVRISYVWVRIYWIMFWNLLTLLTSYPIELKNWTEMDILNSVKELRKSNQLIN